MKPSTAATLTPSPPYQSPVISFNLDKPMSLDDYSKLPDYAQKEYLTKLKRSYCAGAAQIGQMLGITTEDACELMRECGVSAKGRRAANADELWAAFLGAYKLPELAPRFTLAEAEPELTAETPTAEPAPETPQNAQEATALAQGEPVDPEPENKLAEERAIENRFCEAETKPTVSGDSVTALLKAFLIDLEGPMSGILRRMELFADLIGDTPVVVKLAVDEEAVYNVR